MTVSEWSRDGNNVCIRMNLLSTCRESSRIESLLKFVFKARLDYGYFASINLFNIGSIYVNTGDFQSRIGHNYCCGEANIA